MHLAAAYDPFRSLGGVWRLLPRAPLPLAFGALLLFLLWPSDFWLLLALFHHTPPFPHALPVAGLVPLAFVLATLLDAGLGACLLRAARGEPVGLAGLLEPRGRFLALLLARLGKRLALGFATLPFLVMVGLPLVCGRWLGLEVLGALLGGVGALLYLPLWAWLCLGLLLVEEAVVFEGCEPVAALRRSFELVRGRRLRLAWFSLVTGLLALGGICLCGVGLLLTGPWACLAWREAFVRFGEGSGEPSVPAPGTRP